MFGKSLVELCCVHDVHILNGRLYDDIVGNFTCLTGNGAGLIDYHLASTLLFPFITYFNVLERDESDHLPVHSVLSFKYDQKNLFRRKKEQIENRKTSPRYKWNDLYKEDFIRIFMTKLYACFDSIMHYAETNVNQAVKTIIEVYQSSSERLLVKPNRKGLNTPVNQPWWDRNCDRAKYRKYAALRRFRSTNQDSDYIAYIEAKRLFKNICAKKI